MVILLVITLTLILISIALGRTRCVEMLLVLPFAAGAAVLLLFGVAPGLDLSTGNLMLPLCLAFEWSLLTAFGLVYDRGCGRAFLARPPSATFEKAVLAFGAIVVGLLLVYIVKELGSIVTAPSVADYFMAKRIAAHRGEGVDVSSPVAYRAINWSMALLIIAYSYILTRRQGAFARYRNRLVLFCTVACLASLLEGNRSTMIVSIVAIVSSIFAETKAPLRKLLTVGAGFMLFFAISMQVFRLDGDFSRNGLLLALRWFGVYAFGSIASFSQFVEQKIATYWYAFDAVANKFGKPFAETVGARDFFLMEYVSIGDLHTNVYGGYAVLYDYLGLGLFWFIFCKTFLFFLLKFLSRESVLLFACYVAFLGSYPLTIYHEFAVTSLYYCVNIAVCGVFIGICFGLFKCIGGLRRMRISRWWAPCAE